MCLRHASRFFTVCVCPLDGDAEKLYIKPVQWLEIPGKSTFHSITPRTFLEFNSSNIYLIVLNFCQTASKNVFNKVWSNSQVISLVSAINWWIREGNWRIVYLKKGRKDEIIFNNSQLFLILKSLLHVSPINFPSRSRLYIMKLFIIQECYQEWNTWNISPIQV